MTFAHRSAPLLRAAFAILAAMSLMILAACAATSPPANTTAPTLIEASDTRAAIAEVSPLQTIIPRPVSVKPAAGDFALTASTIIYVDPESPEQMDIGRFLAGYLAPATGFSLAVQAAPAEAPAEPHIRLTAAAADPLLGDEGYELIITESAVTLKAPHPAGLFRGIQTIRQILPSAIESAEPQPGPWPIPAGAIRDFPRYQWRGAMLDVARHFFSVDDVKRYIDLMALYKLNRFHIHLSDDQGWRLMINSWPNLAIHGGSSAIRGDQGGYYTQEQYAEIVAYAHARYITVVPEIDMPGHTNAALASYPELNCNGEAPPLYTGQEVGFSSLCINKEITYQFVDDVIRELAALTPGPWIHIGGDEAFSTPKPDYIKFMTRAQEIVNKHGKQMIGWEEVAQIELAPGSMAQNWRGKMAHLAAGQGAMIIMSPSTRAYLDMKYTPDTPLGLKWAGYVDVRKAYDWDPAIETPGIGEHDIIGVESPLWSETIVTIRDIEQLAFPRLIGHAEIGWTPAYLRGWDEYSRRLARQAPRLDAMGVNFYRDPDVPWPK